MIEWNKESNTHLLQIIGSSIKGRRLQKNLSAKELSQLSGVSSASIARFETGKGNLSLQNLLSILKALEMANELKILFSDPEASPSLLAKATSKKTQRRVKRSQKKIHPENGGWKWGEDKNE